ncbi:MAG: ECF transporter S component [Firmicutes bacterium]|nr:ECF transporter S component [Bacillota bacterium]
MQDRKPIRWLTRTALLLAVALVVQSLRLGGPYGQLITGSIINGVIVLAVSMVDMGAGIAIGLLTPWVALVTGIMGLPFMVPFIMVANSTLAIVYGLFKRRHRLLAAFLGALAKYGFFVLTTNYLLSLFGKQLPPPAVATFGTTQLGTALIGGMLALFIADTITPAQRGGGQ